MPITCYITVEVIIVSFDLMGKFMIGCFDISGHVCVGRYSNLHNLTFLYSSPDSFRMINSRRMR